MLNIALSVLNKLYFDKLRLLSKGLSLPGIAANLQEDISMKSLDFFIPTRVVFGAGRLNELASMKLPGVKALICVTEDGLMEKLGIQQRVIELLKKNNVTSVIFDQVTPNPTRKGVMAATKLAKENKCDFFIGLGGGSSIDTAKATSIMMVNEGDLWDYASLGTGGRKEVVGAFPVMTISTTSGTGTETDPYCVITNEETGEKLDFALDEIFPRISIIDPELMKSLPRTLTLYQGFDAIFHAAECFVTNNGNNRLIDLFAIDAVEKVCQNLQKVLDNGDDIEARSHMAYAADILCGFTQALGPVTSHHIIAQALGGIYPNVAHGATLILTAEQYYKHAQKLQPKKYDEIGAVMGEAIDPSNPGGAFVTALVKLMKSTGAYDLTMSSFGITKEGLAKIADISANVVGYDIDTYDVPVTEKDTLDILMKSFR